MYNSISSVPLTSFCGMHPSCFSSARKVPKGNLTDGLFPTVAKKEGEEKDHRRTRSLFLLEEQFGCKVVFLLLFAQHQH